MQTNLKNLKKVSLINKKTIQANPILKMKIYLKMEINKKIEVIKA